MSRTAQCQCGSLRTVVEGEPEAVVVCSCLACQRRSGSVFGVNAYYLRSQTTIVGESREFTRQADSGNLFRSYFCPSCGTTVYSLSERQPGRIGVSVGAFGDPDFQMPQRSVFEVSKHSWIDLKTQIEGFELGRDSSRSR